MSNGYHLNQITLVTAIMNECSRQIPGLPAEPRLMNCVIAAANTICAEFAKPIVKASSGMGLTAWLASDDVGMSSKFMASVLTGEFQAEFAIPYDPSDFGRCVRMIQAVPELAPRIGEMRKHGPMWTAVADKWERWSEMLNEEQCKALYEEMRAYRQ